MFERLRRVLVESFVGAIALGWTFAQCIIYFANSLTAPIALRMLRDEFTTFKGADIASRTSPLLYVLPDLAKVFVLLLVWYFLLRWLYFKPLAKGTPESVSNPEQAD